MGGGASVDELEDAVGAEARGRTRVGVCGGPADDEGEGRRRVAVDVVWGRTRVLMNCKTSIRVGPQRKTNSYLGLSLTNWCSHRLELGRRSWNGFRLRDWGCKDPVLGVILSGQRRSRLEFGDELGLDLQYTLLLGLWLLHNGVWAHLNPRRLG